MGMFDYVKCNFPLPGRQSDGNVFQTKCLGSNLDQYEITAGGRLVLTKSFWGDSEENKDTLHHGWISFYTMEDGKTWYEYDAKFTDGQLVEIKQTSPEESS